MNDTPNLQRIAKFQSIVLWLVPVAIAANVAIRIFGIWALIPGLIVFALQVLALLTLSRELGIGIGWRVLQVLLLVVPIVGLIVMVLVVRRATKVLDSHGISVGLMGAQTELRHGSKPKGYS